MKYLNDSNIKKMLDMQDSMNKVVNLQWYEEHNPWYRAIWMECAELVDHIGWKWWSKQEIDINQSQMELIDIWHFGLSNLLQRKVGVNEVYNEIEEFYSSEIDQKQNLDTKRLLEVVENFVSITISTRNFNIKEFLNLCTHFNLSFDELMKLYIGKNILNKFRQNNGYKLGNYTKIWNGKEDNYYLSAMIEKFVDQDLDSLDSYIYQELENQYALVKK